jgi:hypothetical protein
LLWQQGQTKDNIYIYRCVWNENVSSIYIIIIKKKKNP